MDESIELQAMQLRASLEHNEVHASIAVAQRLDEGWEKITRAHDAREGDLLAQASMWSRWVDWLGKFPPL